MIKRTIFAIATRTSECYGHGDYGEELRICRSGFYGSDGYPPAFGTRGDAEEYMRGIQWNSNLEVVELELRDDQ